ncbi:MAG: hypothetical protein ACOCVH_00405 [Verrucomicrobiota bacterium]
MIDKPRKRPLKTKRSLFAALGAAGILCGVAQAKVFLFEGKASDVAAVFKHMDSEKIYSAAGSLNGSRGQITIYGINNIFADVAAQLRSSLDIKLQGGKSLKTGRIKTKGGVSRLIILNLPQSRRTAVMQFEQNDARYRQSLTPPPPGSSPCLPRLHGARALVLLENRDTDCALGITTASLTAAEAHSQVVNTLSDSGWSEALQQNGNEAGNFSVLHKGLDICCVSTEAGDNPGKARIAILRKKQ